VTAWADRLRAARANTARAAELERQLIRDARDGGETPTRIADALGVKNRQRIYDILAGFDDGEVPEPAFTPVAYVRGAGIADEAWTRLERAVRARGFRTTHDRLPAWHLCRGGVPVVLIDFSADLRGHHDGHPAEQGGGYVGYQRFVRVGLCKAKYRDTPDEREMLLALVNGGDQYEPWDYAARLDGDMVAKLAAEALCTGKTQVNVPEGADSLKA
jgi:hypothetical protein